MVVSTNPNINASDGISGTKIWQALTVGGYRPSDITLGNPTSVATTVSTDETIGTTFNLPYGIGSRVTLYVYFNFTGTNANSLEVIGAVVGDFSDTNLGVGCDPSNSAPTPTPSLTPSPSPTPTQTQAPFVPGAPTLLQPANNTTVTDNTPTFTWQETAHSYSTRLELSTVADFSTVFIVGETRNTFTPLTSLPNGMYYWRVRTANQGTISGPWSAVRTLTVNAAAVKQCTGSANTIIAMASVNQQGFAADRGALSDFLGLINDDGRYIVYATYSTNVAADTDTMLDIYRFDRQTCAVVLVSQGTGRDTNDDFNVWDISADGNLVLMQNYPVGNNSAELSRLWLRNISAGTTQMVSIDPATTQWADGGVPSIVFSRISNDGRYLLFNNTIRDLQLGITTTLMPTWYAVDFFGISGDGRYLFSRRGEPQYPTPYDYNMYRIDTQTNTEVAITTNATVNSYHRTFEISDDGNWVMFSSKEAFVVADNNATHDYYLLNISTMTYTLLSQGLSVSSINYASMTADANRIVFSAASSTGQVVQAYVYERATGERKIVSTSSGANTSGTLANQNIVIPVIADNGSAATFFTTANNLVPNDVIMCGTTNCPDIFAVELPTILFPPPSPTPTNTPVPPPAIPTLSSPTSSAKFIGDEVVLEWQQKPNDFEYVVQVSNVANFATLFNQSVTTATYIPLPVTTGTFYWRVKSRNMIGQESAYSAVRSFIVNQTAPTITTPTSTTFFGARSTFAWTPNSAALRYQMVLDGVALDDVISLPSFTLPFTYPALTQGLHTVEINAFDVLGNVRQSAPVSFYVFLARTPANNTVLTLPVGVQTSRPTFTWQAVTGDTSYILQIDNDTDFQNLVREINVTGNTHTLSVANALPVGTYYWRILRQVEGSAHPVTNFMTLTIAAQPAVPTGLRITPDNNLSASDVPVAKAEWNAVVVPLGVTTVGYDVQFPPTSNLSLNITSVSLPEFTLPLDSSSTGAFRLRVRTVFDRGLPTEKISAYSPIITFTVDQTPTLPPVVTAPIIGATVRTATVTHRWLAVSGATRYIFTLSGFVQDISTTNLAANYTTRASDAAFGQVMRSWIVSAIDAAGNVASDTISQGNYLYFLGTAPAENSIMTDTTPDFTFNTVAGHTSGYQILIDDDPMLDDAPLYRSPVVFPTGASYTFTLPNADDLDIGTYYWAIVKANEDFLSYQTYGRFGVGTAPTAPTLNVVEGDDRVNVVENSDGVNLSWNAPTNLGSFTVQHYEVQVAKNNLFTLEAQLLGVVGATEGVLTQTDGTYYWRVRAVYTGDLIGAWSAVRSYTIDTIPLDPPAAIGPALDRVINTPRPVFSWRGVAGAVSYTLTLDGIQVFSNIRATSFTYPVTAPNLAQGFHFWTVEAVDVFGNVSFSTTHGFTLALMRTPIRNQVITGSGNIPVAFTWNAMPGVTTYLLEIDTQANFASPNAQSIVVTGTSRTVGLPHGSYHWRVGINGSSDSITGTPFFVTPSGGIPKAILNPVATDNIINFDENGLTVLSWTNPGLVFGADGQQVEISRSNTFPASDLMITAVGAETTMGLPAMSDGRYYWRVRTFVGAGVLSVVGTFVVDATLPSEPALITPLKIAPWTDFVVSTTRPRLVWSSVGATRYEVYHNGTVYPLASATWTPPVTQPLSVGWQQVLITAYDAAGNFTTKTLDIGVAPGNSPLEAAVYRLANGASIYNVPFSWTAIPNTPTYEIYIASFDGAFTDVRTANATSLNVPLPEGLYTYSVYPLGTPEYIEKIVRVFAVAPSTGLRVPTLNPVAGDNLVNASEYGALSTSWSVPTVLNNTWGALYERQVARNAAFTSNLNVTETSLSDELLLNRVDGTHYWRVRAIYEVIINNAIHRIFTPYSAIGTMVIDTVPPTTPTSIIPANNALVTTRRPTFSWVAVSGAVRYRVEVEGLWTLTSATNSLVVPVGNALGDRDYRWTVTAIDAAGNESAPSVSRSFTVDAP